MEYKRSNAPIFWSLFGAGGVVSALLGPVLVLIVGIAVPLGAVAAWYRVKGRMRPHRTGGLPVIAGTDTG